MYIDIMLLIMILGTTILGIKKGLLLEFFSLFGFLITAIFAKKFSGPVYGFLTKNASQDKNVFVFVISYIITFILIYIVLYILLILLKKFFSTIMLGWIDRLGGGLFGLLKGFFISFIILVVFSILTNFSQDINNALKKSYSGKIMAKISPELITMFPRTMENFVMKYINRNYVNGQNIDSFIDKLLKENGSLDSYDIKTLKEKKDRGEVDKAFLENLLKEINKDKK